MFPSNIKTISKEFISSIIGKDSYREGRTIEYKERLPTSADSQKVPWLLKPACSFANTDGGILIFGIQTDCGIPVEQKPIGIENLDSEVLRLEEIINAGIEPQIRGIKTHGCKVDENEYIIIIQIQKSWVAPHRVKNNKAFWARNSAGCYELDIPQIRNSFLASETLMQRLQDFRAKRVSELTVGNFPIRMKDGPYVVFHTVPLTSFAIREYLQVEQYKYLMERNDWFSDTGSHSNYLNLDGILSISGLHANPCRAYMQFYRSGIFEFVRAYEGGMIPAHKYEERLIDKLKKVLGVYNEMNFQPPYFISISLVNIKNGCLAITEYDSSPAFRENIILLPDLEVETVEKDASELLRPLFNMIWNSVGYEGAQLTR